MAKIGIKCYLKDYLTKQQFVTKEELKMMFVVIANNEEKQKITLAAIESTGHDATVLSNLAGLPELLKTTPVSGILIDLITSTRASSAEKESTNDLVQLYPQIKIKIVDGEVLLLGGGVSLEQFIQSCNTFKPRTIRKSERRVRHIPFLLSEESEFIKPEKTVTLNIADGGCFIYSTGEWTVGTRVWLRFIDNDKVMTAIVRWWQPWGNSKKMPGIGVSFD